MNYSKHSLVYWLLGHLTALFQLHSFILPFTRRD